MWQRALGEFTKKDADLYIAVVDKPEQIEKTQFSKLIKFISSLTFDALDSEVLCFSASLVKAMAAIPPNNNKVLAMNMGTQS